MLNSGRIELLDEPRLSAQLLALERRTAWGGRDSIDHAPGGHDDVANAAAGALVLAARGLRRGSFRFDLDALPVVRLADAPAPKLPVAHDVMRRDF